MHDVQHHALEPRTDLDNGVIWYPLTPSQREVVEHHLTRGEKNLTAAKSTAEAAAPGAGSGIELALANTQRIKAVFASQTALKLDPPKPTPIEVAALAAGNGSTSTNGTSGDAGGIVWGDAVPTPRPARGEFVEYADGSRREIADAIGYDTAAGHFIVEVDESERAEVYRALNGAWRIVGANYAGLDAELASFPGAADDDEMSDDETRVAGEKEETTFTEGVDGSGREIQVPTRESDAAHESTDAAGEPVVSAPATKPAARKTVKPPKTTTMPGQRERNAKANGVKGGAAKTGGKKR